MMRAGRLVAVVALAANVAACSRPPGPSLSGGAAVGLDNRVVASTTTVDPGPKVAQAATRWPKLDVSAGAKVVVSSNGVVLPIRGLADGGGWRVTTPCTKEAVVRNGRTVDAVHVVIDPGHGGTEVGAVAANGVREKDVNLTLANVLANKLRAHGITAQLTREGDYRLPILTRAEIVTSLQPKLFISIHHNGGGAPKHQGPGTEVFYQRASPESKRLAGLVWEEVTKSLSDFKIRWIGSSDAGAIYRSDRDGSDFYGVLRRSETVPSALAELAYLSNAAEAAIIDSDEFREAAATAMAAAIVRYFATADPGSGFNTPVFRGYGDGGGGTTANCKDPVLL